MEKVWVFSFIKPINNDKFKEFAKELKEFLANWKAHGKPVSSEYKLIEDRFLMLRSDTKCGSSVDRLFEFLFGLFEKYEMQRASEDTLFFKNSEGIFFVPFKDLKNAIAEGKITPETPYYDATIMHTGNHLAFETTAGESWLKKYFKPVSV